MNKKLLALYSLKFNPFSSASARLRPLGAPADRKLLLAHRTAGRRRRLCPGQRRAGHRQKRRPAHPGRAPGRGCATSPSASSPGPRPPWPTSTANWAISSACRSRPHNRWASAKALREKWLAHIETSLYRPVLLIDEAQEMNPPVLSELRLLASADLDSRSILTVILAGDRRLAARLEEPDLLPIASRIRSRLRTEALPPKQLQDCLNHLLKAAGNPKLLSARSDPDPLRTRRRQPAPAHEHGQRSAGRRLPAGTRVTRRKTLLRSLSPWIPNPPKKP